MLLTDAGREAMAHNFKGLTQDSRAVKPGWLFAALPGSRADGRAFMLDALRAGASVILAPEGTDLPEEFPNAALLTDPNPRKKFAQMAADFYAMQPEVIAAVTGTNGKTSTVHFTRQLWERRGLPAASLGTLGVIAPGGTKAGSMTTPDAAALHAELADLASVGVTHLAMEASSHGLDQYRLDGVRVSAAGFTNLTRDHLDYHPDMDAYFAAKARLFSDVLLPGGTAVLNMDSEFSGRLADLSEERGCRVIGYGRAGAELRILGLRPLPHGQEIAAEIMGRPVTITLPLVGAFMAMNALCALGLVLGESCGDLPEPAELAGWLEHLEGAPGRLQLAGTHPTGAAVYVDYAHTPDALENVLKALRAHVSGRLVCVFGCGGDRDPGKRPIMGGIAARLADTAIVTDDNPRSEDPAVIRSEIMAGGEGRLIEIGDRREAIRQAVSGLHRGDVLVVAGKGHERGQIVKGQTLPFDDAQEVAAALEGGG